MLSVAQQLLSVTKGDQPLTVCGGEIALVILSASRSMPVTEAGVDMSVQQPLNATSHHVAIAVYSGRVPVNIQSYSSSHTEAEQEDGRLVSGTLVEVATLGNDGTELSWEQSPNLRLRFPLARPLPFGGGPCEEPPLFGSVPSSVACVAGCCRQSNASSARLCECSDWHGLQVSTRGLLCDLEVRCRDVRHDKSLGRGCTMQRSSDDFQVCDCRASGTWGVVAHTMVPATTFSTFMRSNEAAKAPSFVTESQAAAHHAGALCTLLLAIALALALTVVARLLDRQEIWVSKPPAWLRAPADGWRFLSLLRHNVKLYHAVIRIAHVVPGHVAHTRAQKYFPLTSP